ncbi:MAG: lysophospholipid acyltransferase family protein [Acidobacteriaceae bacterium]|nr:lysophospholipid acyltransferase family protein [Acidobacteriaceae bacterium]
MFVTFKMVLTYVVLGTLAGVLGIPYSFVVGNVDRLYRVVMWILRTGLRAGGIRVEVSGQENVPAGVSCIYLSNHVSNLDPPVIFPALPGRSAAVLKKELMRIPFLGTAMRMGGFIPVERGRSRTAAQSSVAAAVKALQSGLHILIFAEGTRSKDGRLAPFKRGTFYMAMETGAPIVPVVITGTEKMMRKHSAAVTPGLARITMLPAIYPANYATREELMQAVRQEMIAALPEEMRPLE